MNLGRWLRCCLKIFLFLALAAILSSERNEFGPVEGPDVILRYSLCLAAQNGFFNFGRGHYEELFCDFLFNLDWWFRRWCLKIFLYLALVAILFRLTAEWNGLSNFGRGHYEELFCDFFFNLDWWFRRWCLKIFLYLALVTILFRLTAEGNGLSNFGRGHYEEHSCEIILNLEMLFKDIFWVE